MTPFSKERLPSPPAEWPTFRKHALTHALRMDGPFEVATSEGLMRCQDGWLAVDARGYPYPIADDEFRLIYDAAALPPQQLTARWPEIWRRIGSSPSASQLGTSHLPTSVVSKPLVIAVEMTTDPENARGGERRVGMSLGGESIDRLLTLAESRYVAALLVHTASSILDLAETTA